MYIFPWFRSMLATRCDLKMCFSDECHVVMWHSGYHGLIAKRENLGQLDGIMQFSVPHGKKAGRHFILDIAEAKELEVVAEVCCTFHCL